MIGKNLRQRLLDCETVTSTHDSAIASLETQIQNSDVSALQTSVNNLNLYAPIKATVQTTNASATTLYSYPLVTNSVYAFEAFILYTRLDNGARGASHTRVSAFRTTGNATLVGASAHIWTQLGTPAAVFDASGTDVRLRVTGQASTTLNWTAYVYVWTNN